MRTESRSFDWNDERANDFFEEHGYVIVDGVLGAGDLGDIERAWTSVVAEAAAIAELPASTFNERFPQNRNLWRKNDAFRSLLFDSLQSRVVRHFLRTTGVRLFHDQAISKPAGRSSTIPWHQDSAYWPLDRVGLSIWTPTNDVPVNGGCLKVLDGSHRGGPGAPQDFLSPERAEHDADPRLVYLPVRRGQSVVLDGLTWHSSDPNTAGHDRLAYLTLWVPASARFVPEHANWHPSSAHIEVAHGERLAGEYFPMFGEHDEATGSNGPGRLVSFRQPSRAAGPSMFTASKDIARQLAWLQGAAGTPANLGDLLHSAERRAAIAGRLVQLGVIDVKFEAEARELLAELSLQERVRRLAVARDVYLRAVSRWWELAGARLEGHMMERPS